MSSIEYQTFHQAYKIIRIIGEGSNGKVYEIQQKRSQKKYALKIQKLPNLTQMTKSFHQFEVAKCIDHKNSIKIFFYYMKNINTYDKGSPKKIYQLGLIMENGLISLEKQIQNRYQNELYFSQHQAIDLMKSMIDCLTQIQKKGYIHRDIKPANILKFVNQNQIFYKLCDYGFAVKISEFSSSLIAGSYDYSSPKITQKFKNPNKIIPGNNSKDDVYSLGITFVEMLCLKRSRQLQQDLNKIKNRYGEYMCNFIKTMLHQNQLLRPNFIQLNKQCINLNIQYINPSKTLTTSDATNSHFSLQQSSHINNTSTIYNRQLEDSQKMQNFKIKKQVFSKSMIQKMRTKRKKNVLKYKMKMMKIEAKQKDKIESAEAIDDYQFDNRNSDEDIANNTENRKQENDRQYIKINEDIKNLEICYFTEKNTQKQQAVIFIRSETKLWVYYKQQIGLISGFMYKVNIAKISPKNNIITVVLDDRSVICITIQSILEVFTRTVTQTYQQIAKSGFYLQPYKSDIQDKQDKLIHRIPVHQLKFQLMMIKYLNLMVSKIFQYQQTGGLYYGTNMGYIGNFKNFTIFKAFQETITNIYCKDRYIYVATFTGIIRKFQTNRVLNPTNKKQDTQLLTKQKNIKQYNVKNPILYLNSITNNEGKSIMIAITHNGFVHQFSQQLQKIRIKRLFDCNIVDILMNKQQQNQIIGLLKNGRIQTYNLQTNERKMIQTNDQKPKKYTKLLQDEDKLYVSDCNKIYKTTMIIFSQYIDTQ